VEPSILLLDEPLSNLDAALRKEMQVELKRIHDQLRVTTVFVTPQPGRSARHVGPDCRHEGGKIIRIDVPSELYHDPRSKFVCTFLGEANLFEGKVIEMSGSTAKVQSGDLVLKALLRAPVSPGSASLWR